MYKLTTTPFFRAGSGSGFKIKFFSGSKISGTGRPAFCRALVEYEKIKLFKAGFSRLKCLERQFSASITCSDFEMEIKIPKCLLKGESFFEKLIELFFSNRNFLGLQFSDVEFNSQECTAQTYVIDGSMNWKMNYNDCGTNRVC